VSNFEDMAAAVRKLHGPVPVVVERDGAPITVYVDVTPTQRFVTQGQGGQPSAATVGAIVSARSGKRPLITTVVSAIPATVLFTADLTGRGGQGAGHDPDQGRRAGARHRGGQRDPQTPMSVVGASIIGGDTVDHGLWVAFWFFLAQLNLILGAINLVPLLPFDGGHIAIALFEKIRNLIDRRAERSRPPR